MSTIDVASGLLAVGLFAYLLCAMGGPLNPALTDARLASTL